MIKVGDVVRLKKGFYVGRVAEGRQDNRTATVRSLLTDIEGGLFMDRDLRGCRYWNVEDVEVVS